MSRQNSTQKHTQMNKNVNQTRQPHSTQKWIPLTALVSGLLAFLFFFALPFLPVKQVQSSFNWPQDENLTSVNAPLISLAPEKLDITVPLAALEAMNPGQTTVLSTLPEDSTEALDRGLFVNAPEDGGINVSTLNEVIFELDAGQVAQMRDGSLRITVDGDMVRVDAPGTKYDTKIADDMRPQVTGIYTELSGEKARELIDAGLTAHVDINSRFTSSPSTIKWAAMILGSLSGLVALWALAKLDLRDGRRLPLLRPEWKTFKPLDGVVLGVLGFWHIFGANTSDDGFLLTMARVANDSDYMANYYRWYGVPEAPFGSPFYDVLSLLAKVSTASAWMRLPTLIAGICIWWILSREILPRLGEKIATRRVAYWTAAFMFLAFWLPYDNGLRPEPIIALGAIATWASFESAISSRRLLPAAMGTIFAAFTLACGPTGLTAVGVFLVCLPQVLRIVSERRVYAPMASMVAPFLAVGFAVMVPVFHDQTLAAVLESTSVRSYVGPALEWYHEFVRYANLFEPGADGSLARRFAMLTLLFCLGLVLWALTRWDAVPGANKAPTQRLLAIFGMSMFFLMFTPTKWTHHFGIYAGLAGAAAALGAVALSEITARSARARTFALAAITFILALSFAGANAWWYISSFSVPWWDKSVQVKRIEAASVLLAITFIIVAVGIYQSFSHNKREKASDKESDSVASLRMRQIMKAPIAVACILVVTFSCLTFVKAFATQAPAYSVGMGNLRSLKGDTCQLSGDVLVETNTNDSFLTPVDGVPLGRSLESGTVRGFHPGGVPAFINSERKGVPNIGSMGQTQVVQEAQTSNDANADPNDEQAQSTSRTATQGNRSEDQVGINGSTVRLPFNLDYNRVPVLGSFAASTQATAELKTSWYELPEATEDAPLLVTSVAGRISHHDINGVKQKGQTLVLQYGTRNEDGSVSDIGELEMFDPGPAIKWRNLRYPIADLPDSANVVRLVGEDINLDPFEWMAVTPLRNPKLEHLTDVFDKDTPGLLDWTVALQFPCHRTFNHYAGVAEIPQFRISPDAPGKEELSDFMDFLGGGALATSEAVNSAYEIPGYLDRDWGRDWGSVHRYVLRTNSRGEEPMLAKIDYETVTRSGVWHPSDMKIRDPYEKTRE